MRSISSIFIVTLIAIIEESSGSSSIINLKKCCEGNEKYSLKSSGCEKSDVNEEFNWTSYLSNPNSTLNKNWTISSVLCTGDVVNKIGRAIDNDGLLMHRPFSESIEFKSDFCIDLDFETDEKIAIICDNSEFFDKTHHIIVLCSSLFGIFLILCTVMYHFIITDFKELYSKIFVIYCIGICFLIIIGLLCEISTCPEIYKTIVLIISWCLITCLWSEVKWNNRNKSINNSFFAALCFLAICGYIELFLILRNEFANVGKSQTINLFY